jgi:hypothetical protein
MDREIRFALDVLCEVGRHVLVVEPDQVIESMRPSTERRRLRGIYSE